MAYAGDMVNEQLRAALIANASLLGGHVAKYADENKQKSFNDLNTVLARHRLVKVINLSIFGFSRGAALARAFSNLFIKNVIQVMIPWYIRGLQLVLISWACSIP